MNTNLREWKSMMSFLVLTPLLLSLGQQAERRSDASAYGRTERSRSGVGRRVPTCPRPGRPVLPQERIGHAQLCVSQHDFVRAGEATQFGRSMRSALAGRRDDGQLGGA